MKPRQRRRKVRKTVDREKKKKRMIIGFGVIMILLMVLSILGAANYGPDSGNQMKYGEYTFSLEERPNGGSVLVTEIAEQQVEFQNLPVQVSHLNIDPAAVTLLQEAQQIMLIANPTLPLADAALVDYVRLQLSLAIQKTGNGMSQEDERYSLPVLNCSHASVQMPVVIFNMQNGTGNVTTEGPCVFFNGANQELTRVKDRVIFEYYGILENGQLPE